MNRNEISAKQLNQSRLPVAKWYEYIQDPALADAILDRLTADVHRNGIKRVVIGKKEKNTSKHSWFYTLFSAYNLLPHKRSGATSRNMRHVSEDPEQRI